MRPNSVGVLYAFQQISIHIHGQNHQIVYPSRKISILLGGAAIWMSTAQNTLEAASGDGNILPLVDMASISRTIGRLIAPFERDFLHACAPQRFGQRWQIQQRTLHQNLLKKLGNPAFSGSSVDVSAEEGKITKFGGEYLPE